MNIIHTPWFLSIMVGALGLTILGVVFTVRQNQKPSAPQPQAASTRVLREEPSAPLPRRSWQCEQCGQAAGDPEDLFCGTCGGPLILFPHVRHSSSPRSNTQTRLVSSGKRHTKTPIPSSTARRS